MNKFTQRNVSFEYQVDTIDHSLKITESFFQTDKHGRLGNTLVNFK